MFSVVQLLLEGSRFCLLEKAEKWFEHIFVYLCNSKHVSICREQEAHPGTAEISALCAQHPPQDSAVFILFQLQAANIRNRGLA